MKRIDIGPLQEHEFPCTTPHAISRQSRAIRMSGWRGMAAVVAATLLALVLTTQLAAAGEFSPCDKVKRGSSGQCYAWKKDC